MKSLSLLFLLLYTISVNAQEKEERIYWDKERDLSWDDFKAKPDDAVDYSANTNSGISLSWNYSTSTGKPVFEYEVTAYFDPNKSWIKPDAPEKDRLLAHEQLHFDISELFARKLRKALEEYEIGVVIRRDMNRLSGKFEKERKEMQQAFDRETSHSENVEAEARWRKFISAELKKLDNFAD